MPTIVETTHALSVRRVCLVKGKRYKIGGCLFHFGKVLFDLGFEGWKVIGNDRNHLIFIHYIITVNNEVTHADNITPRSLRVCITEFKS